MLHHQQQQKQQVNMLQKQTMYGLGKTSNSNSTKELTKGVVRKSSSRAPTHNENPFTLKDRDLNRSNDKKNSAVSQDRSAKKTSLSKGAPTHLQKHHVQQRSSNTTRSPVLSGRRASNPTNNRISNAKSPTTTSLQSSGKKTPCISALVQQTQHHQLALAESAQPQALSHNALPAAVGCSQQMMLTMADISGQKSVTTRYEMDHNDLMIAEEENDGSSFLQNEREAQKQAIEEEATDDARSQLSQNLIGAHLITNKDLYPFRAGSAFQTPKPSRDAINSGVLNSQSPMTSYRNQMCSNIQSNRHELLQMSQKTTVTNKISNNGPQKIDYEFNTYFKHSSRPQHHHNHQSPENKENPHAAAAMENSNTSDKFRSNVVARKTQKFDNGSGSGCGGVEAISSNKRYEKPKQLTSTSTRIEQLSSLALNVRKQTSPENRGEKRQVHEVEVNLTLVDKTESSASPSPTDNRNPENATDSPEEMEHSAEYPRCLSTIQEVVQSGTQTFCLTVQPTNAFQSSTQNGQDESYEDNDGTRLIDDDSAMSPESVDKPLDPYQQSTDMGSKRFSSMMQDANKTCSPANIKLEPVRIVKTSAFEAHHDHPSAPILSHNDSNAKAADELRRESISPVKRSASPSPQKASAPAEVSIITEEDAGTLSPQKQKDDSSLDFVDTGNPVLARSIYENLKRIEAQSQQRQQKQQQMQAIRIRASETQNQQQQQQQQLGEWQQDMDAEEAAAQQQQVVCATISASDVSVVIDDREEQKLLLTQKPSRPESSNGGQTRRRRDQRKTPSGRQSANQPMHSAKLQNQNYLVDEQKRQLKRSKYTTVTSTNTLSVKREKQNTSASPLEQPVVSAKTQYEDCGPGPSQRQRSTSANRQPSANAMRRSSSTNQSCPTPLSEQIRLANLQKAKQYGNRVSSKNRSGGQSRQASSPIKGQAHRDSRGGVGGVSPINQYSPVKPEILQACDLSVSMQPPSTAAFSTNSFANFQTQQPQTMGTQQSRRGTFGGASSKLSSHNSSIKRHKRHEMKLSKPAQQAKIDFVKKTNCAKKIQRSFRGYLRRQAQIEKELAEEAARHEQHMLFVNGEALKIQRSFKAYLCRVNVVRALEQRQKLKMTLNDVVQAWKTRRSLNCLGSEVQEFVNCENEKQRRQLRNQFHTLFKKVISSKLYLEENYDVLQKLRQQIARQAQQAASKGRRNQPSNCAKRATQRLQQIVKNNSDSPFKKGGDSPSKMASSPQRPSLSKPGNIALHNLREENSFQNAPAPRQHKPALTSYQQQVSSQPRSRTTNDQQQKTTTTTSSLHRNGSSQRRIMGGGCHKNSTSSITSLSRLQLAQQKEQMGLPGQQDEPGMGNTTVRNSFDNQAMNELKNFIQNSDKKNESFCSIQVSKNKLVGGGTSHQQSLTALPRDSSNGKAQQQVNNSQVVVQVHNGSLTDVISPSAQMQSSDAKPVNIMLGSCTRFKDPNSGRKVMYTGGGTSQNPQQQVEEEQALAATTKPVSQYSNNIMEPQVMTSDTRRTQAHASNMPNIVQPSSNSANNMSIFDQRKTSQDSGSEYRQNLKRVRPRVDCWNRSATRGEATPNNRQMADQQQQLTNVAKDSYRQRGDNSGIKTPVHGASRNANHASTAPPVGSFTTTAPQTNQQQKALTRQANQHHQLGSVTTGHPQQTRQSFIGQTQQQCQQQQQQQNHQPVPNESFNRSRSTNQVGASEAKRQPSMLREPTKFAQPSGVTTQPRAPGSFNTQQAQQQQQQQQQYDPRSGVATGNVASNRIEQLSRPKSSQQVGSSATSSNLRQYITGRTANAASTRLNNHRSGGLNVSGSNLGSSRPPLPQTYQPMQTQIFEMRETLANLTQAMEAISCDAEANQKQVQRDLSQGRGGFGLNSQHRAAMKSLQTQERQFANMMETLQVQFASFRDQAVPAGRSLNVESFSRD